MRMIVFAVAALLLSTSLGHAEDSYVAVFHTLTTKGTYEETIIQTTAKGVSRDECQLRKNAWWAEHGPQFELIKKMLAEKGQHTEFSVACESK